MRNHICHPWGLSTTASERIFITADVEILTRVWWQAEIDGNDYLLNGEGLKYVIEEGKEEKGKEDTGSIV